MRQVLPTTHRQRTPDAHAEEVIHRFEQGWRSGQLALLEQHAVATGEAHHRVLVELAHIDLEFRIKAGEPARASEYFSHYPSLARDVDAAVSLILAEFEFRLRRESTVTFEALLQAYPPYAEPLRHAQAATLERGPRRAVPIPSPPGYEMLERLGEGGMGVVYKAHDPRLGRHVALKFLPPEYAFDKVRLTLFLEEAKTASALNHPHICTVHDLAEHEGRPFIVFEFVQGRTVREVIAEGCSVEFAVKLISQAARALSVAHAAGVVHRDVKPENLMVRADGYLKVLDFGLAARRPEASSPEWSTRIRSGMPGVVGTVPYMSPEQGRGDAPGPASDIFSLGVVLYELITGRNPFLAGNPLDTLVAIGRDTVVAPSRLCPAVPQVLDELVDCMLAKEPARRPSAADVDAVLSSLMVMQPKSKFLRKAPARPTPTVGRAAEGAVLRLAFETAAAGEGRMVCVVGEAGIGKSMFVEECLATLRADGMPCLIARGRCSEHHAGAEAYLPILEALESLMRESPNGAVDRLLRTLAPSWFAEMTLKSTRAPESTMSSTRMKRELLGFLQELSRTTPVVLFVDDLHGADDSTTDLLAYLSRHAPALRLLLVVAYRRDELVIARHPFLPIQQDLQARGLCQELRLELLTVAEIDHTLKRTFPGHAFPTDLSATFHARTGGNPLFLANLLRDLVDHGRIAKHGEQGCLAADMVIAMPESIRGSIRRKLDRLGPTDQQLLAAAAIRGVEFDSAVLARGLGWDEADVEERLQELDEVHGLVTLRRDFEFPDGTHSRQYAFVHAFYQESLNANLTPARRASMSKAQAEALMTFHQERWLAFVEEQHTSRTRSSSRGASRHGISKSR